MHVLTAGAGGFCWGVRRATNAALEASVGRHGPVHTLGPLIHNPQALAFLEARQIREVESLPAGAKGTVLVRAHGIPLPIWRQIKERRRDDLRVLNGTCPEVAKVHSLIQKHARRGCFTILLGSKGHPEALAHQSYASNGFALVTTLEEARLVSDESLRKAILIAQTTFQVDQFEVIAHYFKARLELLGDGEIKVFRTICPDTWTRQAQAKDLAVRADAVVVVGGRASNNTRHLADVVRGLGKPVQQIETALELNLEDWSGNESIAVLAGASTPRWVVDEVRYALENHGRRPSGAKRLLAALQPGSAFQIIGVALGGWGLASLLAVSSPLLAGLLAAFAQICVAVIAPLLAPATQGPVKARFWASQAHCCPWVVGALLVIAVAWACLDHPVSSFSLVLAVALGTLVQVKETLRLHGTGIKEPLEVLVTTGILFASTLALGGNHRNLCPLVAFTASLAFSRACLRSRLALEEDWILGRESLAVLMGERGTNFLAGGLPVATVSWLIFYARPQFGITACLLVAALSPALWILSRRPSLHLGFLSWPDQRCYQGGPEISWVFLGLAGLARCFS